MERPSYSSLSPEQKSKVCNGIGPGWFPEWLRNLITETMSWFFDDASWCHHDFGYLLGFTEGYRWLYDWKFLKAMCRDAVFQKNWKWKTTAPVALLLSVFFYLAVMLFGWIGFHYGDRYRTVNEILDAAE